MVPSWYIYQMIQKLKTLSRTNSNVKLTMCLKNKILFLLFPIIFTGFELYSQIHIGPKAGIQGILPVYGDAERYDGISLKPMLGFNAGFGLDYNINKRFSFYTELIYSLKENN
jgi:hypothetical protein